MKKFLFLVAALLALSFTTGCATLADATSARGQGMSRVYDQPYDVGWDAVNAAVAQTRGK